MAFRYCSHFFIVSLINLWVFFFIFLFLTCPLFSFLWKLPVLMILFQATCWVTKRRFCWTRTFFRLGFLLEKQNLTIRLWSFPPSKRLFEVIFIVSLLLYSVTCLFSCKIRPFKGLVIRDRPTLTSTHTVFFCISNPSPTVWCVFVCERCLLPGYC